MVCDENLFDQEGPGGSPWRAPSLPGWSSLCLTGGLLHFARRLYLALASAVVGAKVKSPPGLLHSFCRSGYTPCGFKWLVAERVLERVLEWVPGGSGAGSASSGELPEAANGTWPGSGEGPAGGLTCVLEGVPGWVLEQVAGSFHCEFPSRFFGQVSRKLGTGLPQRIRKVQERAGAGSGGGSGGCQVRGPERLSERVPGRVAARFQNGFRGGSENGSGKRVVVGRFHKFELARTFGG